MQIQYLQSKIKECIYRKLQGKPVLANCIISGHYFLYVIGSITTEDLSPCSLGEVVGWSRAAL